jgi:hypothetical protein
MRGLWAVFVAFPAWADTPVFVDETVGSGLASVYAGDWQYMVGGGVSAFDCNADLLPDLVLAGGEGAASVWVNRSGAALRFEKAVSGVEMTGVTGAYPMDIDSDGVADLIVLRVGENVVMRGLGACRFERANEAWGFDGGDGWSTALAATFERGAEWPTIAVGNYVNRKEEAFPWGSCTPNWLHRPGEGGFAPPIELKPSFCALSMLFTDWDNSGQVSLRVSNDREYYKGGQEQLWHMEGEPRLYTEAEGWARLRIWGMGIATDDLDGDGLPEYYLTSMADNKLQKAVAQEPLVPKFADIAFKRGVTAHRPFLGEDLNPSTAWHAQFGDVNNDGLTDLFVAKGNVDRMPDFALHDPNNLMLQQADGTFVEVADKAGVASMRSARGGQLVDLNRDGLLDLVVVNRREGAQVWRNTTAGGHWVGVRLHQDGTNPDAIGARIEMRAGDRRWLRETTVGGGHMSGSLGVQHFGLGVAEGAEVRVVWPDGSVMDWTPLAADGVWRVTKGAAPVAE